MYWHLLLFTIKKYRPYKRCETSDENKWKKYDVLENILWKLAYKDVEDVKEHIELYIESKKINIKNTIRDLNIFVKMTYAEYNKNRPHQLNYYPEMKLWWKDLNYFVLG